MSDTTSTNQAQGSTNQPQGAEGSAQSVDPGAAPKVAPELLEILRCPVAVHYMNRGDDPGRLRLVKGCWLVCDDSGYKYPVLNGIPNMLPDEGLKYKDVAEDDLPCPPPSVAP